MAGYFAQTLTLNTAVPAATLPLQAGTRRVSTITISHLSLSMPPFLASVNQIGFDSYDWIASTLARTRSTLLMWVIGARRGSGGAPVVDPASPFAFPLLGHYEGDSLALQSANVALQFSFGAVPLARFELRGTLGPDLRFAPGANVYAETVCAKVPGYGPELLGDRDLTRAACWRPVARLELRSSYVGSAGARLLAGVSAGPPALTRPSATAPGAATVMLSGPRLPSAARHVATILLVDAGSGAPVSLDYHSLETSLRTGAGGSIRGSARDPGGYAAPPAPAGVRDHRRDPYRAARALSVCSEACSRPICEPTACDSKAAIDQRP